MASFVERRNLTKNLFWTVFSALCGYLLALCTIQDYSDEIELEYLLHNPSLSDTVSRQTRSLLSLGQKVDSCQCTTSLQGATGLKVNYFGSAFGDNSTYLKAKEKRAERLSQWKKRAFIKKPIIPGIILYTTPIPIIYPYYGLEMRPMTKMSIPALRLLSFQKDPIESDAENRKNYPVGCAQMSRLSHCVTLYAHYGNLLLDDIPSDVLANYNGRSSSENKQSIRISSLDLSSLNNAISNLYYLNTVYEPRGSMDFITVRYGPHKAQIPISIKHPKQPILIDPGDGKLENMVTICIKTFERYACLEKLIESIQKMHPKFRIVIADDSINYKNLEIEGVHQFRMPAAIGFNNGKNLAISQVTTEYLLWMDDDFQFSNKTDLQWMLNMLENTDIDIVGGKAGAATWGYSSILKQFTGDENGDCLFRINGNRGLIAGYPDCVLSDVIQNFYMARTLAIRKVGFDGLFKRISHKEFFLDGLGKLKIALCSNIEIIHEHSCIEGNQRKKLYMKYREPEESEYNFIDQSWFMRSNLKCISERRRFGDNKVFFLNNDM